METLEGALVAFEAEVESAQKASDALLKAIKKIRLAAHNGQVADLEKGLAALDQRGQDAADAVGKLRSAWTFDARSYLASDYPNELRQAAEAQGLNLVERDGRLFAFPLMLRIDARDAAVRLGKKSEKRLRPKLLIKLLSDFQKRPLRFREEKFLALLHELYQKVSGSEWKKNERASSPAVSLFDMHALLTLLPGADYPIEEFGRDLLLLDRSPDLRTRDGASFQFEGSTGSKGTMKRVVTYDEGGNERTYVAIRFRSA